MGEFKYWMVGRNRVHIIERFGTSTLVEYVKTGVQASVNTDLVRAVKAKPYVAKNPKKDLPPEVVTQKKKNNNNPQTSLDL